MATSDRDRNGPIAARPRPSVEANDQADRAGARPSSRRGLRVGPMTPRCSPTSRWKPTARGPTDRSCNRTPSASARRSASQHRSDRPQTPRASPDRNRLRPVLHRSSAGARRARGARDRAPARRRGKRSRPPVLAVHLSWTHYPEARHERLALAPSPPSSRRSRPARGEQPAHSPLPSQHAAREPGDRRVRKGRRRLRAVGPLTRECATSTGRWPCGRPRRPCTATSPPENSWRAAPPSAATSSSNSPTAHLLHRFVVRYQQGRLSEELPNLRPAARRAQSAPGGRFALRRPRTPKPASRPRHRHDPANRSGRRIRSSPRRVLARRAPRSSRESRPRPGTSTSSGCCTPDCSKHSPTTPWSSAPAAPCSDPDTIGSVSRRRVRLGPTRRSTTSRKRRRSPKELDAPYWIAQSDVEGEGAPLAANAPATSRAPSASSKRMRSPNAEPIQGYGRVLAQAEALR